MSTIINCVKHKYENYYTFTVSKNIDDEDDENSFQVDIDVRVNESYTPARINHTDSDYPSEGDFKIDYDSIEIKHDKHSETEKKMIEEWVKIHTNRGTFEDAFGKSYFEIYE
jgi:hypothetical protein